MLRRADTRAIRDFNRSVILELVRHGGRFSRSDLARRSRLTRPTVAVIIEHLLKRGIVREVGLRGALLGGRPARMVEFNDSSAAYLGIHFGARATVVALANARGVIRHVRSKPSPHEAPERSVKLLRPLITELLRSARVGRTRVRVASVVVPGLVDQESGVCTSAPSLGWRDFALRDALAEELRVPVIVSNVAQASAVAEVHTGAARGASSVVWLSVGSEIAAGIIVDGQLFFGHRGFSGEVGHCSVLAEGPECVCGRYGCLDAVVSNRALERAVAAALSQKEKTSLSKSGGSLDVAVLAAAAEAGDSVAARMLADFGEYLGKGISYLLNVLNPEMLVVGGEAAVAGEALLRHVRASVARHALLPHAVSIVSSTLRDRAEVTGAVLLAMESRPVPSIRTRR